MPIIYAIFCVKKYFVNHNIGPSAHRRQPGEGDAQLEGIGDVDEVLVFRFKLGSI
jgi:hypothetical protein